MCYIIYNKLNKKLNDKELIEAYSINPDGIGICYNLNNKNQEPLRFFNGNTPNVEWFKSDVLPKIKELNNNPNVDNLAIHFRLASAGNVSKDNVHPFKVKDNIYLMMNGTSTHPKMLTDDNHSDTYNIAQWLSKQDFKSLEELKANDDLYYELCCYIGNANVLLISDKCLIIPKKPENIVLNKDKSIWRSSSPLSKHIANKYSKE